MTNQFNHDICIIGAGAGGLSIAAGASQLGLKVALIEADKMGGDCLNYGCIPSKAILASAKHYYAAQHTKQYGFTATVEPVSIKEIMQQAKLIIKKIEPHDSIERFTNLGVDVYTGVASFINKNSVQVNDILLSAKYFVLATGSSPVIPQIKGLDGTKYFTNETIFGLEETPEHLLVLGGGPIGAELAQAFIMLGVKVTLITTNRLLVKDAADLVAILRAQMLGQGLNLYENVKIIEVIRSKDNIEIVIQQNDKEIRVCGSHLLLATGRVPNIDKLNLAIAGVEATPKGVSVDKRLRTSNKKIFAVGDVIGGYQFTHVAGYHAGIVIRNIAFRQWAKVNYTAVPWVTYTYPELAHVGMHLESAQEKFGTAKVYVFEFEYSENDRAQVERTTLGKIKLITTQRGKVLGVSILGASAGELLLPWVDMINRGESVKELIKNIVPYPTLSDLNKQVVGEFYKPILFSPKVRQLVKFLKIFW